MNIFVVDRNPAIAAASLCDKHVIKMPLETAQMLSTISGGPYKPTHVSHPCTLWTRSCSGNYLWLWEHGMALCREYTRRYGKIHACQSVIQAMEFPPPGVPGGRLTEFVQCMPDEYRGDDPVEAYRRYYIGDKQSFATWKTEPPLWWPF